MSRLYLAAKEVKKVEGQTNVAKLLGQVPQTVKNWESRGVSKPGAIIAESVIGTRVNWVLDGVEPMLSKDAPTDADSEDELDEAGSVRFSTKISVVGTAKMGDDGYYEEISSVPGEGDGYVLAHSADPEAYALRVKGESMFPAIRHGWYVVVEPNTDYRNVDIVLVKLACGRKMVKSLLQARQDCLIVESVNGGERRTIDFSDLDPHHGVQAVAAILPSYKWRPG